MTGKDTQDQINNILDFLNAPEDEYVIAIDCSDCDQLASLAEAVAAGTPVESVLPALSEHLRYWRDCREEFDALVAVLKAESDSQTRAALDEITRTVAQKRDEQDS
ncbi:MAG: hypothetical protein EA396_11510 [Anaerolineaceae bacterium]|nr:MAG: hypothetical protein EA396_11510 [Anaerolineaceae bacterium]